MTVGIDDGKFFLVDHWPGEATNGPNPADWTAYSATEDFVLGTKRLAYDDVNNGWAIFMYLKFNKGTTGYATAKSLCGIDTVACKAAGGYHLVCNDAGEVLLTGPIAICLGTTSATALYGWFWVGGVCPVGLISGLDGVYKSDGSVVSGSQYLVLMESASICKFHVQTATDVGGMSAFSMAVDSTS